ncbi:MAG: DUF2817 domain-containing protein [Bacteriovoracaceae bacterium]|nr:DUF2817 domain-containing protein [Bacteriovoracaceae bacterium]
MIFKELSCGKSVEKRKIKIYKTPASAKKYFYLMAGVHGDEISGIYVLKKLFTWLKKENITSLPLIVIPIANPDGHAKNTRKNAHQVDLNRNLPTRDWTPLVSKKKYHPGPYPLSEPENQFLVSMFEQYPPALIISFHSWKPILNYNGKGLVKKTALFLAHYNDYPVAGDIGYPTPGSLGTFGPEKHKIGVLTFECPPISKSKTLENIWKENELGLKALLKKKFKI